MEKEELQSALEEAEAALEQEEVKVQRSQLEISAIRQDIDRRLAEKDEEFENTRKNHQRALDSMQASLEAEARGKAEAMRMKKKLEQDINELEVALDGANRGRAEAEKNIKKFQQQMREVQQAIEDEQRARDEAREQYQVNTRHLRQKLIRSPAVKPYCYVQHVRSSFCYLLFANSTHKMYDLFSCL